MSELAVITGASRGIGLAAARRFLARGARVINLSRTPSAESGIIDMAVDLATPDFGVTIHDALVAAAADSTRTALIHSASSMAADTVESVDDAALANMLQVGVQAPAVLNRILLPAFPAGSSIIYIGSTLSEKAVPGSFSYVVAKHAVIGMMRATCQDLLGRRIHTACVCPGVTDTVTLREHVGSDETLLATLRDMTGTGQLIEPDEIAAIVELAVDNPVLNGAVVHANNGQRER